MAHTDGGKLERQESGAGTGPCGELRDGEDSWGQQVGQSTQGNGAEGTSLRLFHEPGLVSFWL